MARDTPAKLSLPLRFAGLLLMLSGWAIVLTALVMLRNSPARGAFVLAGIAVELLGLGVVVFTHGVVRRGKA